MRKYLLRQYAALVILLLLMIADPVLSSVLNFWLQKIFSAVNIGQSKYTIIHLLTSGFLIWMGKRVVVTLSSGIKNYTICNVRADLKSDVFHHILEKFAFNVTDVSSGVWTSMFTNDITLIEDRYLNSLLNIISSSISLVILGGAFFTLNKLLAACILGFGALSLIIPIAFSKTLNRLCGSWSKSLGVFTQRIREFFFAFPTIKNFAIEDKIQKKFDELNRDTELHKFDADFALATANNTSSMLAWFMQFISISVGVIMVSKGDIILGTVIAAQAFAGDIAVPLIGIVNSINSMRSSQVVIKKIKNSIEKVSTNEMSKPSEDKLKKNDNNLDNGLVFEHVSLKLSNQEIVRDFSYHFEAGKRYLIIGANGSGKSSLFRMLCQYHRFTEGSITINGVPTNNMDSEDLSKLVSYMNENVSLFTDTLQNNIQLFRDYSQQQLTEAIEAVKIHLDLQRVISDDSHAVSSGERRRIEIARTLLSGAKIFIFDEVISTLDTETAYEIEKMVLAIPDCTVIQISHNFSRSLVEQYDEILILDSGRLIAHGSFQYLLANDEYFQRICRIKFGVEGR